jgi:hypothetical protein
MTAFQIFKMYLACGCGIATYSIFSHVFRTREEDDVYSPFEYVIMGLLITFWYPLLIIAGISRRAK